MGRRGKRDGRRLCEYTWTRRGLIAKAGTEMIDLRPFIDDVIAIVARHKIGAAGAYRRWLRSDGRVNPYGSADAANILYTVGHWPGAVERAAWVDQLCTMQDPRTGLFEEETHHPFHTTAHCIAA